MILDGSNRFFNLLLWSMSIYINMMLMSDLIMRLISPMEKHETAKKIRLFIMVTVCLVCAIAFASDAPKLDEINSSALVFLSILLSFFYIMAFSSLIVAAYLIWNLGLGQETKSKIVWRHTGIVMAYSICNSYLLLCLFDHSDNSVEFINRWYVKLFQALFYTQGVILPFLRMIEPGILKLHVRLFLKLARCRFKEADEEEIVEPISILLNSTLNIEFVYVILEGIVNFSRINFS